MRTDFTLSPSGIPSVYLLTVLVKLTEFGFAEAVGSTNKDDERAAALARRAQRGDYDEGMYYR